MECRHELCHLLQPQCAFWKAVSRMSKAEEAPGKDGEMGREIPCKPGRVRTFLCKHGGSEAL